MQININIQIYTIQNLTNVYTKSKNNHANIDKHLNIYNTKSLKICIYNMRYNIQL